MTRFLQLILAASLCSAGCNLPLSVHPLADETTSVLDERLIGHWEAINEDKPADPPQVPPRFVFGRLAAKPNVLEMVNLELEDGVAKVNRTPSYAMALGETHYLSVLNNPEEPKEKHLYLILLYQLDEDRLKFYFLRPDVVGPAIERGDLKGEAVREPLDPNAPPPEQVKPKYQSLKITASPQELADYLAPRKSAPFMTEAFLQFRRIEPK
jgi:hypothetical protein